MTADHDRAVQAHRIDLVIDQDAVVALIALVDEGDVLLIENLAVRPERQGHGLGEALLRHAEAVAAASRQSTLRLYTNARFAANLRFYARRGFVVTREEVIAVGTVVHMVKAVALQEAAGAAR